MWKFGQLTSLVFFQFFSRVFFRETKIYKMLFNKGNYKMFGNARRNSVRNSLPS